VGLKAKVVARTFSNPRWSGPTAATFFVSRPPLLITEIMYHPAEPPSGSSYDAEDFEFIEIKNAGATALNLHGFKFSGGVEFTFPTTLIVAAGQRVVVAKNRAAFESRYGVNVAVAGEYTGNLDNAGERLVLTGPLGEPVLDFPYSDSWLPITDGAGFSLVIADETAAAESVAWRPSAAAQGSPGALDPAPAAFPRVVINEVLSSPPGLAPDVIEVQNLSLIPIDIGDWFLTDDRQDPMKYRIPKPTVLVPGEIKTFSGTDFDNAAAPGVIRPFGLSSLGEEIYLFSGGPTTNLTGYLHGFEFGAQQTNIPFGRHADSLGREHFVSQSYATLGQANAGPRIGPVIISEIMYHPPEVFTNGAFWNNTEDEYIELLNVTDRPVELFDFASATNTWQITGDIDFVFPANAAIPANGFLVLVSFDPARNPAQLAAFRSKYSVAPSVPILGPFSGNLDNRGGTLRLLQPLGTALNSGSAAVPYVLIEEVAFEPDWPWPPAADGFGFSLNRIHTSDFADDPASWSARLPSPAKMVAPAGNAITIVQQPVSQIGLAGQTLVLRVAASGDPGLKVQWRLNGGMIPSATNFTLTLRDLHPDMSGEYTAVVWSTANSVASAPARVSVEIDTDGDGMPDSWEFAHGLNPFERGDALADTDGEGMFNLEEYLAGTDPRDSQSFLMLESSAINGSCELCFNAAALRSYTVLYTDSLNPVAWTKLADVPAQAAPFRARVLDPAASTTRYYRLEVDL
jgi:hypothetical protein